MTKKDIKVTDEQWAQYKIQYEGRKMSMQAIGEALGVSKQAVHYKAKKDGWAPGIWTAPKPDVTKHLTSNEKSNEDGDPSDDFTPITGTVKEHQLDAKEEVILSMIVDGYTLSKICIAVGCSKSVLMRWFDATEGRAALVSRARQASAHTASEEALRAVKSAKDMFQLAKAKEIAIHKRWEAKALNPRVYGDKQQLEVTGSIKQEMDDGELSKRIMELQRLADRTVDAPSLLIEDASTPSEGT